MTAKALLEALIGAEEEGQANAAIVSFEEANRAEVTWLPVGRENNRGTIESASDPGRSLVERLTNGIDAVLEGEHDARNGIPNCVSPRDAAIAWLGVPPGGLSDMQQRDRLRLAKRVAIRVMPGSGRGGRLVEIRDSGIGIAAEQMAGTILSLSASNKIQKLYLAGAYGQGGSSTFAVSKVTLIASRFAQSPSVSFTVVRFLDLPPDVYKIGHYVYLCTLGTVLRADIDETSFRAGTLVKAFGYDLTNYPSPLGPNSVYGLLQETLFDPVMPVWLEDKVHHYGRVIKGSRNALNGATDEGDEGRGPSLAHSVRLFHVPIGEFGRIGVEYWVLEPSSRANKRPSSSFVNSNRPIVLTVNGQTHAPLPVSLIRKGAELPFLAQRLVCHVDCNSLTANGKRALFVSNREGARQGLVHDLIEAELIKVLKSDDDLARLNKEAKDAGLRENDEDAIRKVRSEVARLLRLQGVEVVEGFGGQVAEGTGGTVAERPSRPRPPRPPLQPIELHEPPTFIRILWEADSPISFYRGQRRYLRIETDAQTSYHNPNDPTLSRLNLIVTTQSVGACGSTPLQGGRMRAIFEGAPGANIGDEGVIRVELSRSGLPVLFDERPCKILAPPPEMPRPTRVAVPQFKVQPVNGPDDPLWTNLAWPDNPTLVASSSQMEDGVLNIYYSTVYPKFSSQRAKLQQRDAAMAASFTFRYEIWLAVHSLLHHRDQQALGDVAKQQAEENAEMAEEQERLERQRIATLSAMFAIREIRMPQNGEEEE